MLKMGKYGEIGMRMTDFKVPNVVNTRSLRAQVVHTNNAE